MKQRFIPKLSLLLLCPLIMGAAQAQVQGSRGKVEAAIALLRDMHYEEGFAAYRKLPKDVIDPEQKLLVAMVAYTHGDSAMYLSILLDLMAAHGYEDSPHTSGMLFHDDISSGRHAAWYDQHLDSCRIAFFSTHLARFHVIDELRKIYELDQARGVVYTHASDQGGADSILSGLDGENFHRILALANVYGLPNNMDDQWNATGIVNLVLHHCGKNPDRFQERWDAIWPYLERAYSEGKISNGFLFIYDQSLSTHTGMQSFGTLPDVPVRDSDGLRQRRTEHGLEP
jgi:hypothetical protein